MTLLDRPTSPTPKRIIALDGGGIRGVMTLGFVERIESILRQRYQNPEFRLCDYFDLIGGTSTGSIIASALAIGMSAQEIKKIYLEIGEKVFGKKKVKVWEAFFDMEPLKKILEQVFCDRSLGDESLKTGLCIVTKRADTGSTWPFLNHPQGQFYASNRHLLLREVIRASTAAPAFFIPEMIDISLTQAGAFVDGGVSMANNPALQLFLIATLKGYGFNWATGENQLLLTSLGTGIWRRDNDPNVVAKGQLWNWAQEVPLMLMDDSNWHNQLILQYISRSPTAWTIDAEIGDLSQDLLTPEPILSYLRYDVQMDPQTLTSAGLDNLIPKIADLQRLEGAENRFDLDKIGTTIAEQMVKSEHFPADFDLS